LTKQGNGLILVEKGERTMQTSKQVKEEFLTKLRSLLREYNAVLEAKDYWNGYSECGEDVRATVAIPSIFDEEGNQIREWTDIDLGGYFTP